MHLETGKTVEFSYTDAQGVTRSWTGEVRRTKDDHFRLDTREGPRTFRFDRVEGEIKVLKG